MRRRASAASARGARERVALVVPRGIRGTRRVLRVSMDRPEEPETSASGTRGARISQAVGREPGLLEGSRERGLSRQLRVERRGLGSRFRQVRMAASRRSPVRRRFVVRDLASPVLGLGTTASAQRLARPHPCRVPLHARPGRPMRMYCLDERDRSSATAQEDLEP